MTASQLLGAGLWAVFALIVANVVALAIPGLTAGAQPIGRAVGVAFGLGVATAAYGVASWAWNYDTERYYECPLCGHELPDDRESAWRRHLAAVHAQREAPAD